MRTTAFLLNAALVLSPVSAWAQAAETGAAPQPTAETPVPTEAPPQAPPASIAPAAAAPAAPPVITRLARDEQPETMVSAPLVHGGYAATSLAYTRMRGEDSVLLGARAGWLINHRLVLGVALHGLTNHVSPPSGSTPEDPDYRLNFGFGGAWFEYVVAPMRLIHASAGLLVGGGALSYHPWRGSESHASMRTDPVFVVEPSLAAELNLTSFLRLALEGRYRAVRFVDLAGLDAKDVSGFSSAVLLKFGMF